MIVASVVVNTFALYASSTGAVDSVQIAEVIDPCLTDPIRCESTIDFVASNFPSDDAPCQEGDEANQSCPGAATRAVATNNLSDSFSILVSFIPPEGEEAPERSAGAASR